MAAQHQQDETGAEPALVPAAPKLPGKLAV